MDSNLRKRKKEKQALHLIRERNRQHIASVKNDRWSNSFSQYSANFPQIFIK